MPDDTGLSDEERAELEALRAEKAARERAERDARDRAELERLRREHAAEESERAAERRDAEARERGRRLMEPDDEDLRMAPGQRAVIIAVVVVALVWLAVTVLG